MPDCLFEIRERFTKNAKKIKTETRVRDDILKQYYYDVRQGEKFSLLVHLLREENPNLSIIFCNSRMEANVVYKNLQKNGINAATLHGGLSQQQRERVMEEFHNGVIKILVATDVAARGLDIKNVTHVFNYNIPRNMDDYTNRIGRTARAGESGKAICLLSKEDHSFFRTIIRGFDYCIEKIETPDFTRLPFDSYRFTERMPEGRRFVRRFARSRFRRFR